MATEKIILKGIIVEKGNLGTSSAKLDLSGCIFHQEEIPVTLNFDNKKVVGKAKPYIEDGVLKADLELDESKMFDGKHVDAFFPAIAGRVKEKKESRITKFDLIGISLCSSLNSDSTIKSIGEQRV